ncbi:glycosyltransferase family 10 domain-containing protein [Desulfocurvibacter africanus]|uniref:glycosyltransferase family 10 domain-containing protein n=1 Tax=Desulfocurvibacter africanus TaxID=873 RepID=UPI002FD90A66
MNDLQVCIFCTQHVPWPWFRQTESGEGICNGVRFLLNEDPGEKAEWLVVFDSPARETVTRIPRHRRILVITEPPEVKPYPPRYLRQFGVILTPFLLPGRDKNTLRIEGACLNWHYGVGTASGGGETTLDSLKSVQTMPVPPKRKLLSVICSTKTYTQAQRARIALVEQLMRHFGPAVDLFGRGRNPIDDKADAIADYKYHIVLENNRIANFWTEKLSDAWIGYSLPLYAGAPNITGVIPDAAGLVELPIDNHNACIKLIEDLLEKDPYQERFQAIARCREWCLESTNVFARVAQVIREADDRSKNAQMLTESFIIKDADRLETAVMRRLYRYNILRSPG